MPWKILYLDVIPPVFHFGEVDSIRTNIHIVRSDPLVSVLPSLSSNSCDLHWPSHINLQPLFIIIAAGRPGANEPSATRPVKPRQPWCVILIPLRRSCDGRIFNSVVLQANRSVVKSLWNKNSFNRRLYSLRVLKQCGAPPASLAKVYTTIVRPVLEYAAPVWQIYQIIYRIRLSVFRKGLCASFFL